MRSIYGDCRVESRGARVYIFREGVRVLSFGYWVLGLGFEFWVLGFGFWGFRFRVCSLGLMDSGSDIRVKGRRFGA